MKIQSTKWALALSAVALSTLFTQNASACGKDLAFRLSVLTPNARQLNSATPEVARAEDSPQAAGSPVGMWTVNVSLGGQVIYQAFESFASEGLEFLNDNGPTLEGNVCFGVWSAAQKNSVKVYHPAWNYDANGNLIGTVIIREQFTFEPGGNSFKGTVTVDTYDLNGVVSAPQLQAQISGKRVTPN